MVGVRSMMRGQVDRLGLADRGGIERSQGRARACVRALFGLAPAGESSVGLREYGPLPVPCGPCVVSFAVAVCM